MQIDTRFEAFMNRRRRLVAAWRVVGPLSLLVLAALYAWLFIRTPLMMNPFEVAGRLQSGAIDEATLALMSLLLPVMISACFLILVVVILLVYAVIANEKKYLQAIDRLAGNRDG